MTPPITILAPAKINLNLRITGRRADGYHLIDSLVIFANLTDRLTLTPASQDSIIISGSMAQDLSQKTTSIHQARDAFRKATNYQTPLAITLEKNIPISAGLGGGSADAAATLQAMRQLTPLTEKTLTQIALTLGADVPALLTSHKTTMLRMQGIGEIITPLPKPKPLGILLVKPKTPLPTKKTFTQYTKQNPKYTQPKNNEINPIKAIKLGNDLLTPAQTLNPEITEILKILNQNSGLSGAGNTCFKLFPNPEQAHEAQKTIPKKYWSWSGGLF